MLASYVHVSVPGRHALGNPFTFSGAFFALGACARFLNGSSPGVARCTSLRSLQCCRSRCRVLYALRSRNVPKRLRFNALLLAVWAPEGSSVPGVVSISRRLRFLGHVNPGFRLRCASPPPRATGAAPYRALNPPRPFSASSAFKGFPVSFIRRRPGSAAGYTRCSKPSRASATAVRSHRRISVCDPS